jgi:hypothetical protein
MGPVTTSKTTATSNIITRSFHQHNRHTSRGRTGVRNKGCAPLPNNGGEDGLDKSLWHRAWGTLQYEYWCRGFQVSDAELS